MRFSVIAASLFDQNPWDLFSLIVATCLLYQRLRLLICLPSRIKLVPIASEILTRLVGAFKPSDIAISSYGIREGLLYKNMPQELRDRDPLIEACYFSEAKDARIPGSGNRLLGVANTV